MVCIRFISLVFATLSKNISNIIINANANEFIAPSKIQTMVAVIKHKDSKRVRAVIATHL